MGKALKILAIDDEILTQTFIQQVLKGEHQVHIASAGEEGIHLAAELLPDIIILDVKMPGMDGYTVCQKLKEDSKTCDIPVLFLSAHTNIEEQLQGYAAGGDDYLVKPCEPETLRAKVNVMLRFRDQSRLLKQQYTEAQKTAHIAMLGSSEIGMAMQFVEQSYLINDYDELANAFFSVTDKLQLICALMFFSHAGAKSYFSDGSASPLEIELLEKMRYQNRIIDFSQRTFINYPNVTLLVKNMPLQDPERYGRIKDLLPTVLGTLSNKIFAMKAGHAIQQQSDELAVSFDQIKTTLLALSNSLATSQAQSTGILHTMLEEMQGFLPKLALEEDQEAYILDHIEDSSRKAMELNDSSEEIGATFHRVVDALQDMLDKQHKLLTEIRPKAPSQAESDRQSGYTSDVDLF